MATSKIELAHPIISREELLNFNDAPLNSIMLVYGNATNGPINGAYGLVETVAGGTGYYTIQKCYRITGTGMDVYVRNRGGGTSGTWTGWYKVTLTAV